MRSPRAVGAEENLAQRRYDQAKVAHGLATLRSRTSGDLGEVEQARREMTQAAEQLRAVQGSQERVSAGEASAPGSGDGAGRCARCGQYAGPEHQCPALSRVLIQPSYGNPVARRHWAATLNEPVDFQSADRSAALAPEQLRALQDMHPDGEARFWGATASQDSNMAKIQTGDVVLFTGGNQVRGIGEVGVAFRNPAFADTLWAADPDRGSWANVYSLRTFTQTDIPYDTLRAPLGSKHNDNFMGQRLLRADDERVPAVLDAMGVRTQAAADYETQQAVQTLAGLTRAGGQVVPGEQMHTSSTTYTQPQRDIIVRRVESALVADYKADLPDGDVVSGMRCPAGNLDMYVRSPRTGDELIEAKSAATHAKVREALGQVLDYSHSASDTRFDRVSALFPDPPTPQDQQLLHRYGIDVLYRTDDGQFHRAEAPDEARGIWRRSTS